MSKILLIDDDGPTNFYNQYILKKNNINCEIVTFSNGLLALEYLKNQDFPDFIFLDINMPVMDGIEFLEQAQSYFKVKLTQIKIYIMMSVILPDDKLQKIHSIQNVEIIKGKTLTKANIDNIFLNEMLDK